MLKELMLAPPPLTLAVAESVTGGRLQARIAAEAGASGYFRGGITAYALAQKIRHLGVESAPARAANAVSAEVARQMARGACALFGADVAVATTGYAEPAPERGVAVPLAYWAVCHRRADNTERWREGRVEVPGAARVAVQEAVAVAAFEALVAHLRDWRAHSGGA